MSVLIASVLVSPAILGQQDADQTTLYTTVDEKAIYIQQGDRQIDVKSGESAAITRSGLEFLDARPAALNWPCGTGYAGNRGQLETFALDSLPAGEQIRGVAQNFFEQQMVLDSQPHFLDGGSHGAFPAAEIDAFVSDAYWYVAGPADAPQAALRPDTLIIGLFYGTGQVIVDTNHLADLKAKYGDDPIPTLFQYHDQNVVPISYFGDAPTPGNIAQVYAENGILPASPPVIFAGDRHTDFVAEVLADSVGAPAMGDIDPARAAQLRNDLSANGFNGKPINLALVPGSAQVTADEPERLRVAGNMGMQTVPAMFSVYDDESHARHCGVAPPVAAAGVMGTEQGDAPGAQPPTDPPTDPVLPPTIPLPPDAGPPDGPDQPPVPPEIELPDPPQPELPASEN
ncbi:hypothetical protein F3N42_01530 [Marinihelvus fidelis]|uniref:Uncharacterized protein n=1 Tax=Marinihelvus fidelis TaxID=2613842 RepID=A0A5N0TDM4_9GAMM|nr:hypothetical protein [Marinihelvus fidelis]KAA9133070.1 hypothetical protein F3N42_01530 [Marinihelvus fidelis]